MSIWNIFCCRSDPPEQTQPKLVFKKKSKISNNNQPNNHLVQNQEKVIPIELKEIEKDQSPKEIMKKQKKSEKKQMKNLYEGQQLEGLPHGTGTMLYVNGDYYRGEWVNGLKEGRGIHHYFEEDIRYEGQWKKNLSDGQGKFTQQNGSFYQGEFKNGKKHGKGEYYDNQNKKMYIEIHELGFMKQKQEIVEQKSKCEQFPTLVLDKQRFNTQDLQKFEDENPEILELDIHFLLKYYGLSKIINLPFIETSIIDWDISQVLKFLEEIGLKDYRNQFYQNKIKGKDLIDLEEQQMKTDLKMKLGDRKKLVNYIKYLYNLNKPKKKTEEKKVRRRGSFSLKPRDHLKKAILSVEQRISEQQNEDQCWRQERSSKGKGKSKIFRAIQDFDIEGWNEVDQNIYPPEKIVQQKKKKKSSITLKVLQNNNQEQLSIPENIRKSSQGNQLFVATTIGNGKIQEKQEKERQKSLSSSSSTSSLDQQMLKLKKKRTNTNGSQEIRQLYEFLKDNKSLDFIIKQKDIDVIEQIGEGGFGKVYRGKYMSCPVAVKDYMKAGRNHKSREEFMKEVYILSQLKHPNIVLYMGMCITVNHYQLVTQFLDNGSLFDQIHQKKTKFSNNEQFEILDDIVKGMVYLHDMKNMLHRDLKSSNVLIDDDWKVKLCDFGLSGHKKKKKKEKSQNNRIGTYQWMAPEVIRNEEIDSHSDVYSFGVIIWELLTEQIPYEGLSEVQITGLVGYEDFHKLPSPEEGDQFLINVMDKCLERSPKDRPTFIQIQKLLDEQRTKRVDMRVDWSNK